MASSGALRSARKGQVRLGLCCQFAEQPIKFRTTTATAMLRLSVEQRRQALAALCLANAEALLAALEFCRAQGIGCFRVNSQILPVKTHPVAGYAIGDLPGGEDIVAQFQACGRFARRHDLRLGFHPDQFVVLNSPQAGVWERSVEELEYQAEVAEWIGADFIILHGGGGYGDKPAALERLVSAIERLSPRVRQRLTLENDDSIYTPQDLLPVCRRTGVPLTYDVHHHRCHPDGLSVEEATRQAMATWNREPVLHVSSPWAGWQGPRPSRHHDLVDPADFPESWRWLPVTVEVEAKAKEVAVLHLLAQWRCGSRAAGKPKLRATTKRC